MTRSTHPQVFGRSITAPISPLVVLIAWFGVAVVSQLASLLLPGVAVTLVHFSLLLLVGGACWVLPQRQVPVRELLTGGLAVWQILAWGVGIGVPTWVALNYLVQPLANGLFEVLNIPVPPPQGDIRSGLTQGGLVGLINIAITALLAPIAEEIYFRGAVFTATATSFGVGVALVAQALFFGLVHYNPVVVAVTLVLGLITGYMVIRKVAIAIPVVIHIVFNSLSVIVVLLPRG